MSQFQSLFTSLLSGWGYIDETCRIRKLAAVDDGGEIVCSEYESSPDEWRSSVDTVDASHFQACSISASYGLYLEGLRIKLDELSQARQNLSGAPSTSTSSALLINLGPVWNDVIVDMRICVWQMQDCIWESPAGLGLMGLSTLASICSRIHEHLARAKKGSNSKAAAAGAAANESRVILHPHTCSHSGLQLAYFVTAAHHIYSAGMESVGDALGVLGAVSADARLFAGQKRYCEYLSWTLHHPHLVPSLDMGYRIGSVRFRKLSAFFHSGDLSSAASLSSSTSLPQRPEVDATEAEIREALEERPVQSFRPERLLLAVYCGGRQVWAGGVTPGSVVTEEGGSEASELCFDTNGVVIHGDVVLAVWFDDHTSRWAPPRIAYAFHTLFLQMDRFDDAPGRGSLRVFARHLDTPGASQSYSDLAEKEGFWMDVGMSRCDAGTGVDVMTAASSQSSSVAAEIRREWTRTIKATGGRLKICSEVEEAAGVVQPMKGVLAGLRDAVRRETTVIVREVSGVTEVNEADNVGDDGGDFDGKVVGGRVEEDNNFEIHDEWTRQCQAALDDLRMHLSEDRDTLDLDATDDIEEDQRDGTDGRGPLQAEASPGTPSSSGLGDSTTEELESALSGATSMATSALVDTPLRELFRASRLEEGEQTPVSKEGGQAAPPAPPPMPPGSAPQSAASTPGKAAPPPPPPMPSPAARSQGEASPLPLPGPNKCKGSTSPPAPPPPPMPAATVSPPSPPPSTSAVPLPPVMTPKTQKGPKLRSVFWKKNLLKDGTVWADIKASNPMPSTDLLDVEMQVLRDLFTQKDKAPPSAVKRGADGDGGGDDDGANVKSFQLVQDLTRANNIAIMLKSFASFGDPLAIKRAILHGDDSLTERHIEQLKQMAPRPLELDAISAFSGNPSDLHLPEQFLIVLADIPRLDRKLNVLSFKRQFEALVSGASRGMDALNEACRQIKDSRRLKCVFSTILASGNALNADTVRGGAAAIKLESIIVLSGVKVVKSDWCHDVSDSIGNENTDDLNPSVPRIPTPKLRTLLDYVSWRVMCAELIGGHLDDDALKKAANDGFLHQELGILRQAVLLIESDVKQNVEALENGMKLVEAELALEERTNVCGTTSREINVTSTAAIPDEGADVDGAVHANGEVPGDSLTTAATISPYLTMLRDFTTSAHEAQSNILVLAEKTSAAQEDIVTWMSERGTTDAPGVLKGILDFSRDFDSSFSRVYNAIGGAKGARAWAERMEGQA